MKLNEYYKARLENNRTKLSSIVAGVNMAISEMADYTNSKHRSPETIIANTILLQGRLSSYISEFSIAKKEQEMLECICRELNADE